MHDQLSISGLPLACKGTVTGGARGNLQSVVAVVPQEIETEIPLGAVGVHAWARIEVWIFGCTEL